MNEYNGCARASKMDRSYRFSILRLSPDDFRGERLNIGVAIFFENDLEVKFTKRLEKLKAMSFAIDVELLYSFAKNLRTIDAISRKNGLSSAEDRYKEISRIGPFSLSDIGEFSADSATAYAERVDKILSKVVDPEPALKYPIFKKTRLLSELKRTLKDERILARSNEGLESHRLVVGYQLDNGLVADLVLKNGAFHVIETVDASGGMEAIKKMVSGIALSALVLERARMKFGSEQTKARIVYSASSALETIAQPSLEAAENQGAELINWSSKDDQLKLLNLLTSVAVRLEKGSTNKTVVSGETKTLFH
ncbi:DUF3037 domain-containing protein [Rhizobium sp. BK491]|uniref:DUF3037 domain-containing protein n=1 Tax=Rhizobium sp. BK491 TaxID=2587009 RepID=UPI00161E45C7|nr:DUF3037 domain-containing protein [Rhizobium sp. BK491]MBB3565984.1 hypothetical protein [Rhizobium sp. BK491]